MQKNQGNYEKVILVICAILALGAAGGLIWLSQGFSSQFVAANAANNTDLGDIPKDKAEAALARLQEKFNWVSPVIENKPVPLNKSVLLVMRDGQLFDLLVEEPVFRPPLSNKFLTDYNLPDIYSPNVADLDPDEDGFSNLDEFNKNTSPVDASDRPPVTDKLYLKERIAHNYILKLRSSNMPVQVQRLEPEPSKSKFVSVGEEFGFERNEVRFRVEGFEKKVEAGGPTGEQDVSELKLMDLASNSEVTLIKDKETNLAKYEARFVFRLGVESEKVVAVDETFQIPGVGTTLLVTAIEEDHAMVIPIGEDGSRGEPIKVPRG
jgi:hypothetical protein